MPVGRSAARGPLPLKAPPPAARCGGGPSPAPWQPSYGRDGAMPGAGDPAALRRHQHVHHGFPWHPLRVSTKRSHKTATLVNRNALLVVVVQTLLRDMNVSPLHANAQAPKSGDRSPGSQTPGDPATPSPP